MYRWPNDNVSGKPAVSSMSIVTNIKRALRARAEIASGELQDACVRVLFDKNEDDG